MRATNLREALNVLNPERPLLTREPDIASVTHQLDIVAQHGSRLREAEERFLEALELRERVGYPTGSVRSIAQMGIFWRAQGSNVEAVSWFGRAFVIAKENGMSEVGQIIADLARLATDLGEDAFAVAWRQAFDGQDPPPEVMREVREAAQAASVSDPEEPA